MSTATDSAELKRSFWKRWYPLFIFLVVFFICFGIALFRVSNAIDATTAGIKVLCWSPDGKAFATAHVDGSVSITSLDAAGKQFARTLVKRPGRRWDLPRNSSLTLQWSQDGKSIASYDGKSITVWDAGTGKLRGNPMEADILAYLSWDSSSRYLSAFANSTIDTAPLKIKKYDTILQDLPKEVGLSGRAPLKSPPCWSDDGTKLAVALNTSHYPDALCMFDTDKGSIPVWREPSHTVVQIAWNPERTLIATLISENWAAFLLTMQIHNATNGEVVRSFRIPAPAASPSIKQPIKTDIRWSKDGKRIGCAVTYYDGKFSNTEDCLLTLWNAEDGNLLADSVLGIKGRDYKLEYFEGTSRQFPVYKAWMTQPCWSPDLEYIAIVVYHISLLAVLDPQANHPGARTTPYGQYGSVVIGKAPATLSNPAGAAPLPRP